MTSDVSSDAGFESLWREHSAELLPMVRGLARGLVCSDELLSKTMLETWRCHDRFDPTKKFAAWVYGFAIRIRRHLAFARVRRKTKPLSAAAEAALEAHTEELAATADTSMADALQQCLDSLRRADDRTLIQLIYYEGLVSADAAKRLGIQDTACRKRLERIREKLQMCIAGKLGLDLGGGK